MIVVFSQRCWGVMRYTTIIIFNADIAPMLCLA